VYFSVGFCGYNSLKEKGNEALFSKIVSFENKKGIKE
jgi:hypothetical protein